MSGAEDKIGEKGIGRVVLWILLSFVGLILLLPILARASYLIEMPFRLICGWALHGWKALPPFLGKWETALLPAGCIFVAGILLHRFIRRWAKEKRPSLEWGAKHTVAVMSLILLCSAAAIATSGIVHQFFWLAGGKVIEDRSRRSEMIVAMSNGRQLMMLLLEFYDKNGRYPHSFDELEADFESAYGVSRKLWWVETGDRDIPEPFLLLRPGSDAIALDEDPLIVSPALREGRMVIVGYGDMSVRMEPASKFEEIMKIQGKGIDVR